MHSRNLLNNFLCLEILGQFLYVRLSSQIASALQLVVVFAGEIRDRRSQLHLVDLTAVVSVFPSSEFVVIFFVPFQARVLFFQFQVLHLELGDLVNLSLNNILDWSVCLKFYLWLLRRQIRLAFDFRMFRRYGLTLLIQIQILLHGLAALVQQETRCLLATFKQLLGHFSYFGMEFLDGGLLFK